MKYFSLCGEEDREWARDVCCCWSCPMTARRWMMVKERWHYKNKRSLLGRFSLWRVSSAAPLPSKGENDEFCLCRPEGYSWFQLLSQENAVTGAILQWFQGFSFLVRGAGTGEADVSLLFQIIQFVFLLFHERHVLLSQGSSAFHRCASEIF